MQTIRILVVDDHPALRKGLWYIIASEPGMEVVNEAADGVEAVHRARLQRPDVIVMDLVMPRKDGLESIREIKEENPTARILVLTRFDEDDKIIAAVKAGASGYLLKDTPPQELLQAIRDVYGGRPSFNVATSRILKESVKGQVWSDTGEPLTERELEIMRSIAH